jgi:AraC-like DNA-binding protein
VAVRQALLNPPMERPGTLPGLAEVAAAQHISPRTLIRRLKRDGTSFQAILDDVRQTLSRDYLMNSDMSIARIAWRLGYQDPSNFSRAFHRWHGQSPRSYREGRSRQR